MKYECLSFLAFVIVGCLVICCAVYITVSIMDILYFVMEVV